MCCVHKEVAGMIWAQITTSGRLQLKAIIYSIRENCESSKMGGITSSGRTNGERKKGSGI